MPGFSQGGVHARRGSYHGFISGVHIGVRLGFSPGLDIFGDAQAAGMR